MLCVNYDTQLMKVVFQFQPWVMQLLVRQTYNMILSTVLVKYYGVGTDVH